MIKNECIQNSSGGAARQAVQRAVKYFSKNTCIRFQEKNGEEKDYIEIFKGMGWVKNWLKTV